MLIIEAGRGQAIIPVPQTGFPYYAYACMGWREILRSAQDDSPIAQILSIGNGVSWREILRSAQDDSSA